MFRSMVLSGALLCAAAPIVIAQAPARPTDPVFVRAQALVSDGNGAAGRALIDSVIKATPPMAPLYPQALFWRASLAASAADAESDYRHIVVDYPLAPQAADALLRLAQLELCQLPVIVARGAGGVADVVRRDVGVTVDDGAAGGGGAAVIALGVEVVARVDAGGQQVHSQHQQAQAQQPRRQ